MLPLYKSKNVIFNYDDIPAGHYFKMMFSGSKAQQYWHRYKFEECLKRINKDDSIMDFGCGPGSFLYLLAQKKNYKKAVGVDLASKQIDFAQEQLKSFDEKVHFISLKNENDGLGFPANSFDVITSIEVIEHIHPYIVAKLFREFKKCLKPDGRMIITTPNYRSLWPMIEYLLNKVSPVKYHDQHINKFTPNSFVKFLETMGLEVKSLNSIFIISPFLSPISKRLAKYVQRIEQKLFPMLGSLLVAEAVISKDFIDDKKAEEE